MKCPLCFSLLSTVILILWGSANAELQVGFYKETCPKVEKIVRKEMSDVMHVAPSLSGPLLRMFFHDCFVRGCDASVLIDTTDTNNPAEKDAPQNKGSLRGYQIIDRVKAKLEAACPGIVSCADIIALVARDVVSLTMGPTWEVPTGRRDGRVSTSKDALRNIPPPSPNISTLKQSFAGKGLSAKDLVVLSGAHTLGISHCTSFVKRIYNFTGRGDSSDTDPKLDKDYVPKLRSRCIPNDNLTFVEMDPGSFKTFDTNYYQLVAKRRGLFQSDAALLDDPMTRAYVFKHATSSRAEGEFFEDFGVSMVNLGNIGVLTGGQGEIRKHCARVNQRARA